MDTPIVYVTRFIQLLEEIQLYYSNRFYEPPSGEHDSEVSTYEMNKKQILSFIIFSDAFGWDVIQLPVGLLPACEQLYELAKEIDASETARKFYYTERAKVHA